MKIFSTVKITEHDIQNLSKSVNPENTSHNPKSKQTITFTNDENSITYQFNNFEKISPLRLTIDDLLTHLSLSKDIIWKIEENLKKKET